MKQMCCSHNKQHQYILLTLESGRLGTAFCLLPFRWQTETDVLSGRTIATSYNSVLIHPDDAFQIQTKSNQAQRDGFRHETNLFFTTHNINMCCFPLESRGRGPELLFVSHPGGTHT